LFGHRTRLVNPPAIEPPGWGASKFLSYHHVSSPALPMAVDSPACHPCHGKYPHKKTSYTRAFLNMHSRRLGCLACHLETKGSDKSNLGWFILGPAGPAESSKENMQAVLRPYVERESERVALEISSRDASAGISQRGRHEVTFASPRCSYCHSGVGIERLRHADYSQKELEAIGRLDHIISFTRGKEFYYPRF